jgi:hypothetical protein
MHRFDSECPKTYTFVTGMKVREKVYGIHKKNVFFQSKDYCNLYKCSLVYKYNQVYSILSKLGNSV